MSSTNCGSTNGQSAVIRTTASAPVAAAVRVSRSTRSISLPRTQPMPIRAARLAMASFSRSTLVLTTKASSSRQCLRRSAIHSIADRPRIGRSALPGRRVEPMRAWMAPTTRGLVGRPRSKNSPPAIIEKPARSNAIRDAWFSGLTCAVRRWSPSGPKASRHAARSARAPIPRPRHSGARLTLTRASPCPRSSRTIPASTPSPTTM